MIRSLLALLLVVQVEAAPAKKDPTRPHLALDYSPKVMFAGSTVRFVAEIRGVVDEEWYCPEVTWTWTDETRSAEESDCDPWGPGVEAPHRWVRYVRLGAGAHKVSVTLRKSGRVLSTQAVEFEVHE